MTIKNHVHYHMWDYHYHYVKATGNHLAINFMQYTEDCKLVVRLQMQNTLGIVVIGQLHELFR